MSSFVIWVYKWEKKQVLFKGLKLIEIISKVLIKPRQWYAIHLNLDDSAIAKV